jgi:hypothetical protein
MVRRPLKLGELDRHLETDDAGKLFWRGEEIRRGGLNRAEIIQIGIMVSTFVAALVALLAFVSGP